MLNKVFGLAISAMLLGGCAANSYCLDKQDYTDARGVPPLSNTDTLKVPASPTALRIPPAPAQAVPFGEKVTDADGKTRSSCLDLPPEMPPMAPIPEAAPEAPAAPTPDEGTNS